MDNEILNRQTSAVTFEEKNAEQSSFTVFLQFLRRFWILLVVATVIGTAAGLGLAFARDKKVYTQTKSLVVLLTINSATLSQNLTVTTAYLDTLSNTIQSPTFINKANIVYSADFGGASNGISASSVKVKASSGMIFTISYSDYDAKTAADKLEAFIKAVREEIQSADKHYVTADSVEFRAIDRVPVTTTSSGFAKYVLLGAVVGVVLGLAIAFLIYLFDNTVSSKSELERLTGAMVVAYIDDVAL